MGAIFQIFLQNLFYILLFKYLFIKIIFKEQLNNSIRTVVRIF